MHTEDYIMSRVEYVGVNILKENPEYKNAGILQLQLIKQIQSLLPKEQRHLVMELNDSSNHQSARAEYIMYEQGFKDCNELRSYK
jgi:type IV pilus biogenesis protein CpaD/CtpE